MLGTCPKMPPEPLGGFSWCRLKPESALRSPMSNRVRLASFGLMFATAALVSGCGSVTPSDQSYHSPKEDDPNSPASSTVFSGGGITLFGGGSQAPDAATNSLGVNAFLWRASLDTVSFMPVASADPFGGVIITDWYSPPESPTERFKVNIFILDRALHSDGIRAAVFRQNQTSDGRWIDAPVEPKAAEDFENAILTRARQLRIASASPQ